MIFKEERLNEIVNFFPNRGYLSYYTTSKYNYQVQSCNIFSGFTEVQWLWFSIFWFLREDLNEILECIINEFQYNYHNKEGIIF